MTTPPTRHWLHLFVSLQAPPRPNKVPLQQEVANRGIYSADVLILRVGRPKGEM